MSSGQLGHMKLKVRYCLFTAFALFAASAWWHWLRPRWGTGGGRLAWGGAGVGTGEADEELRRWVARLPSFDEGDPGSVDEEADPAAAPPCRMETCFDFSRCAGGPPFLHHVHPVPDDPASPPPPTGRGYAKMLSLLRDSPLHTDDPDRACLFFLALDTLDRDRKGDNYLKGLQARVSGLRHWNNGTNHVVFNLFSGKYPDYREDELDFDPGNAILAKASFSEKKYRPGFDISFPLFHEDHPIRDGDSASLKSNNFPVVNSQLLAFKGKRYVYGIGSETRNKLYHLHDGRDIVLVTTCRHNKDWQEHKDARCDQDNAEYDRWDFGVLLHNSTFCLVPRGRRLGSFRLLEVLRAGCIPVVLADGWVLPFAEAVDWAQAAIVVDERMLSQVTEIVRSFAPLQVHAMRQKSQILWNGYFKSVETILDRTLEIIHKRLHWHGQFESPRISSDLSQLSSLRISDSTSSEVSDKFTAIVYPGEKTCGVSRVKAIMRAIAATKLADKIILIRPSEEPVIWSEAVSDVPVRVIVAPGRNATTASSRFLRGVADGEVRTQAVFTVSSADCGPGAAPISAEEIIFAFGVWRDHFPDRLVGYVSRSHYWDAASRSWQFSSKLTNEYSLVMLDAAFYHARFHHLAFRQTSRRAQTVADQIPGCADILMNLVVASHNEHKSPIAVGQRRNAHSSRSTDQSSHLGLRRCFRELTGLLGHVPLRTSEVRLDPALFKDAVSIARKKYRRLESGAAGGDGPGSAARRRHQA